MLTQAITAVVNIKIATGLAVMMGKYSVNGLNWTATLSDLYNTSLHCYLLHYALI